LFCQQRLASRGITSRSLDEFLVIAPAPELDVRAFEIVRKGSLLVVVLGALLGSELDRPALDLVGREVFAREIVRFERVDDFPNEFRDDLVGVVRRSKVAVRPSRAGAASNRAICLYPSPPRWWTSSKTTSSNRSPISSARRYAES